jgi:hypothetical protein
MNYGNAFIVAPGSEVHLAKIDLAGVGRHESHAEAADEIRRQVERIDRLQPPPSPPLLAGLRYSQIVSAPAPLMGLFGVG